MGTALKILFSDLPRQHNSQTPFQLTRNEVVALFQSFGRYASSVREVAEFRSIIDSPTSAKTELWSPSLLFKSFSIAFEMRHLLGKD